MLGARKGIRDKEPSRRPELRSGDNDTLHETLMTITMMTAHLLLSPISKPHIRLELLNSGSTPESRAGRSIPKISSSGPRYRYVLGDLQLYRSQTLRPVSTERLSFCLSVNQQS
jgi:hypothetical protein